MNTKLIQTILIVGAIFGSMTFVIAFIGGSVITATLGPGTSGIITVIFTTIVVVNGGLLLPRFGTLLAINIFFSLLTIPTSLFGPFGWQKIFLGIATGVIYEFFVFIGKIYKTKKSPESKLGYIIGAGAAAASSVYGIVYISNLVSVEPSTKLLQFLDYFAVAYGVLGLLGGFLGVFLFNRYIRDSSIVDKIRKVAGG